METDFLANGSHFFLSFSDTSATDSIRKKVLHFGLVKTDSLASVSHYFISFRDIGNVFLKQILHA